MAKASKKAAVKANNKSVAAPAKKGHSATRSSKLGKSAPPAPQDETPDTPVVTEPVVNDDTATQDTGITPETAPTAKKQFVQLALITDNASDHQLLDSLDKVKTIKKKAITEEDIATADELKEAGIKKNGRSATIPFKSIFVREGFNLRYDFGDLESLANSIAQQGLLKPLTVDLLHGNKAALVDGERRFRAIHILHKRSKELAAQFENIEVLVQDKQSTEKDRIIDMMAHNTGKEFDPMEEAEGFRRLRDEQGMTQLKDIADAVGRSIPYVEQRLILADASVEEKQAILEGVIKPTAFVRLSRETRDVAERKEIIQEALAVAKVDKKGKKRVKEEDIKAVRDNRKASGGKKLAEDNGKPVVVNKTQRQEFLDLANEGLEQLNEVKGLRMQENIRFGIEEALKVLRKMKKLATA